MLKRGKQDAKILDVDASMQGTLVFKDAVNLRINGSFDGKLDTKGVLTIGENASIKADIVGEEITIGGKVTGNIIAVKKLSIKSSAHIVGDITTPLLNVDEGAVIHGACHMLTGHGSKSSAFNVEELAKYLEVEISNIVDWANTGKIPAFKEGNDWKFERSRIDEWIAKEKAK